MLAPLIDHRGPTHSIIILTLLSIPVLIKYRKKAIPYYIALILHPAVGDSLTGKQGTQLLWPITTDWYGLGICVKSLIGSSLEWGLFIGCIFLMLTTRDIYTLLQSHSSNLLLTIPTATVLLPTLFSIPLQVPLELVVPHLVYLAIFTVSILTDLKTILQTNRKAGYHPKSSETIRTRQ